MTRREQMIGYRIKQIRKEKRITQSKLAEGILSTSYISLIERNKIDVPPHLIDQISKRLGVTVEWLLGTENKEINEQLIERIDFAYHQLYKNALDQVEDTLTFIGNHVEKIIDQELRINYTLLKLFLLVKREKTSEAENLIKKSQGVNWQLYPHLYQRFLRVLGTVNYKNNNFSKALQMYNKAIEIQNEKIIGIEKGLLLYNISLCYWHKSNLQESLNYAEMALDTFEKLGFLYNQVEAIILLGTIHHKKSNYQYALDTYIKALKYAEELSYVKLKEKILINLGSIYYLLNDIDKAYKYWSKSLELLSSQKESKEYIHTLLLLCRCFLENKYESELILYIDKLKQYTKEDIPLFLRAKIFLLLGDFNKSLNKAEFVNNYNLAINDFVKCQKYIEAARANFCLGEETNINEYYKRSSKYFMFHFEKNSSNA
jgi:HTH-type transcriptional regulator, quorum sensing regulator NprR